MSTLLRLRRGAFRITVENKVETGDLLPRQEAGVPATRIAPDAAGRIGRDMPATDGMVEDLTEQVQCLVGPCGRGPAARLEPAHDGEARYAVEWYGASRERSGMA